MADYFPDLQHVEEIRRALWAEQPLGRAAVMVGAGMSRNAAPVRAERTVMPTWEHLTTAMIDRLYPPSLATAYRRKKLVSEVGATSSALRLAEEFTATFGRPALDDLVLQAIPDSDFTPGLLHKELLELPWADVLTTNYDTLLERAAGATWGREYSVVRTPEEISAASRPRIVKLHGSFPSSRPFILTEEDFRTYPRTFAPFVNLAQQAIMENVLCLIGFSGDDPNFLYWTGWVRDNLGSYAPKIYLCGILNLSDSQRLVLQRRNVTPIDFTPLFPAEKIPDGATRHKWALEWLLGSLRNGQPYDPLEWPIPPRPVPSHDRSPDFPPLLPVPGRGPCSERMFPHETAGSVSELPRPTPQTLLDELASWKHNRSLYPGWLVAPEPIRERLWSNTRNWMPFYIHNRTSMAPAQELDMLFELNWRLQTALVPIWDDLAPAYGEVLGKINPFPRAITDLPSATLVPSEAAAKEIDWSVVRRQWLSLAFDILRYYREEMRAAEFEVWHSRLGRVSDVNGDDRARWCYERCLYALAEMDDAAAGSATEQWPDETLDAFWAVRKAAILAEVGRTERALALAEAALARLRAGLVDAPEDIPVLSREGWAMWLAFALRESLRYWKGVPGEASDRAQVRARFNEIKKYGCSPQEIEDYFDGQLDQPSPQPEQQSRTTPAFEPGSYSRSLSMSSDFAKRLLPAYQYFRLVEETACPPQLGNVTFSMEGLKHVAEWLSESDPVRTQLLVLRLCDDKLIDRYLSRHRIAALPSDVILSLKTRALRAAQQAVPKLPASIRASTDEEARASNRFQAAVELLARISVRETDEGRDGLWDFAFGLYNPAIRIGVGLGRHLRRLFENLTNSTPASQLMQRLPALFRLPIAGEDDFPVVFPEEWPDPASMAADSITGPLPNSGTAYWREIKPRLFSLTRHDDVALKQTAMRRLVKLYELGVLSASEGRRLGNLFWAPASEPSTLPVEAWGPNAPGWALLLPQPRGVVAAERIKQYILSSQLGEVHGGMVWPDWLLQLMLNTTKPLGGEPSPGRYHYVSWSPEDIRRLFELIQAWWENRGRQLAEELRGGGWRRALDGASFRQFVNRLWDVLRIVIIPHMHRRQRLVAAVTGLIETMRLAGVPVGAVLPATLLLSPQLLGRVASHLREEFANPDVDFHLSALRGIVYWADRGAGRPGRPRRTVLPAVPLDLLREVSMAVALRRPESLALSLDCAYHLLSGLNADPDPQFTQNLIIGLTYLFRDTAYQATAAGALRYPYAEIPRIRWLAARLAKRLFDMGFATNEVIRKWSEAAVADSLPEVRRVFTE